MKRCLKVSCIQICADSFLSQNIHWWNSRFQLWKLYNYNTSFKIRSENFISEYFETWMNPHIFESLQLSNTFRRVAMWKMRKFEAGHLFLKTVKVGVENVLNANFKIWRWNFSSGYFEEGSISALFWKLDGSKHPFKSSNLKHEQNKSGANFFKSFWMNRNCFRFNILTKFLGCI